MMFKLIVAALVIYVVWRMLSPKPRLTVGEAEARAILGVSNSADEETIRAAHRRLVSAVHPDKGGSAELARRINAARDVLLRKA